MTPSASRCSPSPRARRSAHTPPAATQLVLVLEGRGRFTIDGREHFCSAGESIVMPAGKPHAVYAAEDFKMLLTIVFPQN